MQAAKASPFSLSQSATKIKLPSSNFCNFSVIFPIFVVGPGRGICNFSPFFGDFRPGGFLGPLRGKTTRKTRPQSLQGAPPRGRPLYFTFPSAPDPLCEASKAPFPTLRVSAPSGAPCQAPLERTPEIITRHPWVTSFRKPLQKHPTHRVPKPPQQQKINFKNPKIFENPLE